MLIYLLVSPLDLLKVVLNTDYGFTKVLSVFPCHKLDYVKITLDKETKPGTKNKRRALKIPRVRILREWNVDYRL